MEKININKLEVSKSSASKIIDNTFNTFTNTPPITSTLTIADFWVLYDKFFNEIPNDGDVNSHKYILSREAQYLGINLDNSTDIDALVNEITSLKAQVIKLETKP